VVASLLVSARLDLVGVLLWDMEVPILIMARLYNHTHQATIIITQEAFPRPLPCLLNKLNPNPLPNLLSMPFLNSNFA